ncbi:MAG: TerB family tellurite resistance protein [Bacteroidales bacterium]|nr:TerB family tellurite resistance protein [Bacteroidales bacterium]
MSSITKWLFAGLGWAIGGPIGALLGWFLGKAIAPDRLTEAPPQASHRGPYRNTGSQQDINAALMVLIAAVMKADGQVKRSELDYVKRFLLQNYGEQRGKQMLKLLQQLVEQDIPVADVCAQIKVNTDYNTRYHMTDFLFGLGGADGHFHQAELHTLRQIALHLGLSSSDYTSIHERHVGSTGYGYGGGSSQSSRPRTGSYGKDPYKILGIDSSATDDEVKKAYRRMAMKYHPDRVAGMSEELQRNASEQMKAVNQAYEQIKHLRPNLK